MIEPEAFSREADRFTRSSRPPDPEKVQHRASYVLFFRPIGLKFQACPQAARATLSERKSGLEMGVDAGKTTQDAIGPASRRPTYCGFADGVIGTACNPLKPELTSDKSQYVNQVKLGTAIGIMTNQNARNGQLAFLLLAFSCLAMFQPGCSKVQDIDQLRQAAEQGDAEAQNKLGAMYANGERVPEDAREAVKWFRKAAEQGFASAQYNLGLMYDNGEGVPEDDREAAKWLRKAAEQGDASAQYNLGVMYANGEGVPEDYVKAYAWINLAAAQGQKDVVKSKDRLRPKMTSAQVAKAQELSGELYKRIEASKSR